MTAGKGVLHAEMPNKGFASNVGMQLWVDLPQELKGCEPRYRDLRAKEIPQIVEDNGKVDVKIISGRSHGTDSVKELAYTPVWMFDVTVRPGGNIRQEVPTGWNAFAYTLQGSTRFGEGKSAQLVGPFYNTVFGKEGAEVVAEVAADAEGPSRFSKCFLSMYS
jgi:redox-sensitive bicupin YhaK (pirin superfamily)